METGRSRARNELDCRPTHVRQLAETPETFAMFSQDIAEVAPLAPGLNLVQSCAPMLARGCTNASVTRSFLLCIAS